MKRPLKSQIKRAIKKDGFILFHKDTRELLKDMKKAGVKVSTIVTDPPYKVIGGGRDGNNAPSGILQKNDRKIFKHNDIEPEEWMPMLYDVLEDGGHCYIMTNTLNLERYMTLARTIGFKLHNVLVWKKNNCTPNRWYMKNCEYTLFFYKGRAKPIMIKDSMTVHSYNNPTDKVHPTEKPVELMEMYILNSTKKGEIVFDPFVGGGATGIASVKNHISFIGNEIDEEYNPIARDRITGNYGMRTKSKTPVKMTKLNLKG